MVILRDNISVQNFVPTHLFDVEIFRRGENFDLLVALDKLSSSSSEHYGYL